MVVLFKYLFFRILRVLAAYGCLIKDTSGSRGPESGYCSISNLSLQPAHYAGLCYCQRRDQEEEERKPTFPKRQENCQSNSTTCADIKHYCILTFHFALQLSAFCEVPQRSPENGSLSLCCQRINWLFSNFIFPFHMQRFVGAGDYLLSPCQRAVKANKNKHMFHTIFPYFPLFWTETNMLNCFKSFYVQTTDRWFDTCVPPILPKH